MHLVTFHHWGWKTPLNVFAMYLGDSEFIPAGSQPLTSSGQRACLSSWLRVTWDKSPPARTAGVPWGWREGWRKAAQGSPVTGRNKIKTTGLFCDIFRLLNGNLLLRCIFHLRVVFCVSMSRCCHTTQCMPVLCRTVENRPLDCRTLENRPLD